MFHSFFEFVKPVFNKEKLSENMPLRFSVVYKIRVSKILEIELTLISDGEEWFSCCVHYSWALGCWLCIGQP